MFLYVVDRHTIKDNRSNFHVFWQQLKRGSVFWKPLLSFTIFLAFTYTFMEWLFFSTMPSFMSMMSLSAKLVIFLLSAWEFSLICIAVIAVFIIIDCFSWIIHGSEISRYWGLSIPTAILSALILLLVDNFTYTVFKFGISTSTGLVRGIYAIIFVGLTVFVYIRILRIFTTTGNMQFQPKKWTRRYYASLGVLFITTSLALMSLGFAKFLPQSQGGEALQASRKPNIILLGSDGLNANHLSLYGYYRDTTPRLQELAESSLVAENAFSNAGNSAGSVISIMTSKLPTQTRVLYPPNILTGIDSYQHLPGILKDLGYQSVEYGVPYYIDAFNYNLQNGFDMVNNRIISDNSFTNLNRKLGFENEAYFLSRMAWRISDRLLHIFFIREMINPYDLVTQPAPNLNDKTKISDALAMLDQSTSPVFIHIHLLGTHGGYYDPGVQVFSKGERQSKEWMTDYYDDTLLGFDTIVGKVVDHLKEDGQFENTILIIYTDHNQEFKADERVPLIFHFPYGEYTGEITSNVENLDIAPTILDYLGVIKPEWMMGESILASSGEERRLIFSMGTYKVKPNEQEISFLDPKLNKPPFFQFSYINVLDCQRMYSLDLTSFRWTSKDVPGYVNPCDLSELLDVNQIRQAVYQRLKQDGFDTASLP